MLSSLKNTAKKHLFPGLDLHTRCRYRFLPDLFMSGDIDTLDAGFGNGALSYAAYCKGNRVLGVTYTKREVNATSSLFNYMSIPKERLTLQEMNIYDLRGLSRTFDQIICSETLEHITRDQEVAQIFSDLLRPGGRLILCCPYALHPENALGRTDEPEDGRHVRDGYTLEAYESLFKTTDLKITTVLGLGSPLLCRLDRVERKVRNLFGNLAAMPVFAAVWPLTFFDYVNPTVPYSLAIVAEKQ